MRDDCLNGQGQFQVSILAKVRAATCCGHRVVSHCWQEPVSLLKSPKHLPVSWGLGDSWACELPFCASVPLLFGQLTEREVHSEGERAKFRTEDGHVPLSAAVGSVGEGVSAALRCVWPSRACRAPRAFWPSSLLLLSGLSFLRRCRTSFSLSFGR